MNCLNCNFDMSTKTVCPNCNTDMVLYKQILNTSNKFYNEGLEYAKDGKISQAIETLEKSVMYNSKNIIATNLLGLCYFQIGQIADAVKHWVISCFIQKEENSANEYLAIIEKSESARSKMEDGVLAYNKGLVFLQQKNDDMAILQLKRSVDLNPNLVEAHNLLTLSYLVQNDKQKALQHINSALKIDGTNLKAVSYFYELNSTGNVGMDQPMRGGYSKNITTKPVNDSKINFTTVVSFMCGALIMFLVAYFWIVPAMAKENSNKLSAVTAELESLKQTTANTNMENEKTIEELQASNAALTAENTSYKNQIDNINNSAILSEAEALSKANKSEEVAQKLATINYETLSPENKARYDEFKNKAYGDMALKNYNDGVRKYNNRNYEEAVTALLAAKNYFNTDNKLYDETLYYLGRSYEGLTNNEEAIKCFEEIVNNIPESNMYDKAKARLTVLKPTA